MNQEHDTDQHASEDTDEQEAAHGGEGQGQDQDPKQADPERSSTTWDTEEHSDAPGPFGTGDE